MRYSIFLTIMTVGFGVGGMVGGVVVGGWDRQVLVGADVGGLKDWSGGGTGVGTTGRIVSLLANYFILNAKIFEERTVSEIIENWFSQATRTIPETFAAVEQIGWFQVLKDTYQEVDVTAEGDSTNFLTGVKTKAASQYSG
jgi:hypothetical protein